MGRREPKGPIRERGAAALVLMAALPVVIGLLSMVVDLGYAFHAKQSLQDTLDLAAIAAARHLDGSTGGPEGAYGAAQGVLTDNGYSVLTMTQACADPGADDQVTFCLGTYNSHDEGGALIYPTAGRFTAGGTDPRAVRLSGRGSTPSYFAGALGVAELDVAAQATSAFVGSPLAMLTIRSALVNVDSTQGTALNAVFGGLLGGDLNLSLVSWQGLVDTNISLLDFIDQLAVELELGAGDYEQVLTTDAAVGTVLQAAIDVLERDGGSVINADAIDGLAGLVAIVPAGQTMRLGSILGLTAGTPKAGLDATLSVFDLTQAIVQAANGENGLAASIPVNLGAGNSVTLRLSVIEPPQLSAVGNPELAKADPYGPNQIYVRTAQVRAVVSLELAGLSSIANLANEVLDLVSPVTTLLNNLFDLNLVAVVGGLLGVPQDTVDIIIVPGDPVRIDVSLDLGAGEARITDFNCPPNRKPESLTIAVETALANLRIGKVDLDSVFSSVATPAVEPVALVDIGIKTCTKFLFIPISCQPRRPFEGGGVGVMADTDAGATDWEHTYNWPPEIGEAPAYHAYSSTELVNSVAQTINGIHVLTYEPQDGGTLGGVMNLTGKAINDVTGLLDPVVNDLLDPLLSPTLALLLDETLGMDLGKVDVGTNLTCDSGDARLVN